MKRSSFLLAAALFAAAIASARADGVHPTPQLSVSAVDDPVYLAGVVGRAAHTARGPAILRMVDVIKLQPENSDRWVLLGDLLRQLARDTQDFTLYRPAERSYRRAVQIAPTNTPAFIGLAWATGAAHRFDDSVKAAQQALQLDDRNAEAYGLIGDAAVEAGNYDEAEENYAKMLELRPGLAAYSRIGHLNYLQGNPTSAMSWLRRAIQTGGDRPEHVAWCVAELANLLEREGAPGLALQALKEFRERLSDNLALLAAEARARAALGETAPAAALLERAVSLCPQHETLALLHDVYLADERADDARRIVGRIEDLHRRLEENFVFGGEGALARFYADRGENTALAVTLAEREYSHHRTAVAADTLAWACFRAGRLPQAAKLAAVSLRQGGIDPAALYHAAMIESAQGKIAQAREHLYAALSRAPRFNPVHAPRAQQELDRLTHLPMSADLVAAAKPASAP